MSEKGIAVRSLDDVERLARIAVGSGYTSCRKAEEAAMLIITGHELGLSPAQSLRGIYVVSGKPVLSADLMVAVVRRSGLCESWRTVESTAERCTITTRRRGESVDATRTWTMADAKRAQITGKSIWTAYPATMLRHRCAADLAREVYPDVLMGLYDPEELGAEPEVEAAPEVEGVDVQQPKALPALASLGVEQGASRTAETAPAAVLADLVADIEVQVCRCGSVTELANLWCAVRHDVGQLPKASQTRAWKLVGQRAEAIGSSAAAVSAEVKRRDTPPRDDGPRGGTPKPSAPTQTDVASTPIGQRETLPAPAASADAWRESAAGIVSHVASRTAMSHLENSGRLHLRAIREDLQTGAVHAYAGRLQRLSYDGSSSTPWDECVAAVERWLREGPRVATLRPQATQSTRRAAGGAR